MAAGIKRLIELALGRKVEMSASPGTTSTAPMRAGVPAWNGRTRSDFLYHRRLQEVWLLTAVVAESVTQACQQVLPSTEEGQGALPATPDRHVSVPVPDGNK